MELDAKVSQVWTRSHPAKLFKCWGRPTEVKQWEDNLKSKSSANSGELSLEHTNSDDGNFGAYSPVTTKWNAELSRDREFTVEFSQSVEDKKITHGHRTCNTTTYLSHLDSVSSRFSSHASLIIPAGVWMLRVRKLDEQISSETKAKVNAYVAQAKPITDDEIIRARADSSNQVNAGEFTYMFVRPDDRIDFHVSWNSQEIAATSIKVKFEIRFVGVDDCNQVIGDHKIWATKNAVEKVKNLLSLEKNGDVHNQITALSCVRNPEYVKSMLYNTHGQELVAFFDWLSQDIRRWEEGKSNGEFYPVLRTAAMMTLYDLSRTVLFDIKQYCSPRQINNIFGFPAEFNAVVRGYHFAGREYAKIKYLLDYSPIEPIDKLTRTLEAMEETQTAYNQVSLSPRLMIVLRELQFAIFDYPFQIFTNIKEIVASMPQTRVGEAGRAGIIGVMSDAETVSSKLNFEIKRQLLAFTKTNSAPVRAGDLRAAVNAYRKAHDLIRDRLALDIKWFEFNRYENGYVSTSHSQFTKDMQVLNHDLVKTIGEDLGFLHSLKLDDGEKSFLKLSETAKLYDEVVTCLGKNHD